MSLSGWRGRPSFTDDRLGDAEVGSPCVIMSWMESDVSNDVAIVSYCRTPIGRAFKGAFNNTHGITLAGLAINEAVARARVIRVRYSQLRSDGTMVGSLTSRLPTRRSASPTMDCLAESWAAGVRCWSWQPPQASRT